MQTPGGFRIDSQAEANVYQTEASVPNPESIALGFSLQGSYFPWANVEKQAAKQKGYKT